MTRYDGEKDTRKLIVEIAERLFQQMGFQKTTVSDIARELRMSPANVYRFFGAKSEINEAVCMDLLGKIEAEASLDQMIGFCLAALASSMSEPPASMLLSA